MKHCLSLLSVCLGLSLLGAPQLHAEDAEPTSPISLDTSVGVFSDYMFRGQNLYAGNSIQPSAKLAYDTGDYGKFAGSVWMQIPGENGNQGLDNYVETDYTLSYELALKDATFSLGNVWYRYPHNPGRAIVSTNEVYASIALNTLLTPTLTVYQDSDAYRAQYYELGISHQFQCASWGDKSGITPFASLGFATNAEDIYHNNGLETATIGAQFNLSLGDIGVVPVINYTFKIDDNTVNAFWAGVTLSYSL